MKRKHLYYPENLDLQTIIEQDTKLTTKQKSLIKSKLLRTYYIIHLIVSHDYFYKSDKPTEYVKINQSLLKSILSKKYDFVIGFLLTNNIIERNEDTKYVPGVFSYGYKLTKLYNNSLLKSIQLNIHNDKLLFNNLNTKQNKIDTQEDIIINSNLKKIKIDRKKAIELLKKKIGKNKYNKLNKINNNIDNTLSGNFNSKESKSIDGYETYKYWISNIISIENEDFFNSYGKNNNRLYTNITSLPKELRGAIYVEGHEDEKLAEIDISNSQPFLFTSFLRDYYYIDDMFVPEAPKDVLQYIKLTSDGKFYEFLMNKWNVKNRETFKKEFFGSVFYCRLNSNKINEWSKKFNILFPNIMYMIKKYKEKSFKNLSIQLQRLEADIILNSISARLTDEIPGIWFSTIHDSIVCLEEYKDYVEDVMWHEFKKRNMFPTLKNKMI